MRAQVIGLGTLLFAMSSMLLRSALQILIFMGVLWLIGFLYPFVARSLGLPQTTLYEFFRNVGQGAGYLIHDLFARG